MTQINIHHVHPCVTSGPNRPHPLRNSHIRAGEHLLSLCCVTKIPWSSFRWIWAGVTNSYFNQEWIFSLCCLIEAKEIRASPGPENSRTRVSNADHCNGHFLLFLLSKDPAITFTMLPSHLQVNFHPKFQDRCWTSPSPCWRQILVQCLQTRGTRDPRGCSFSSRFQVRKFSFQQYWILCI